MCPTCRISKTPFVKTRLCPASRNRARSASSSSFDRIFPGIRVKPKLYGRASETAKSASLLTIYDLLFTDSYDCPFHRRERSDPRATRASRRFAPPCGERLSQQVSAQQRHRDDGWRRYDYFDRKRISEIRAAS